MAKIVEFRILGTDTTHRATIDEPTNRAAEAAAIRIFAEADIPSVSFEILGTARAGEARNLPTLLDAITNL